MSQAELFALVSFIILVLGAITGAWWRIETKVKEAKTENSAAASAALGQASLAMTQIAELRVHVAENYTSKQNLADMMQAIMRAISDVKDGLDRLNSRVDGVIDRRHED